MGPFSSAHFKVQVNALNRSRPGISTHFSLPFNSLCHGMQVMHRSGYVITDMRPISTPENPGSAAQNNEGTAAKIGKALISKLSSQDKDGGNKEKSSQRRRQRKK
jgi:hypothetical protein|tara:strand:- start:1031 stop:1345 length:315 start_codon:yes stop_codon:yes gene_type:complete